MKLVCFVLAGMFAACTPAPSSTATAPSLSGPVALFVGDSLTAGYGVEPEEAWPALVGENWKARGLAWSARDAAVSGATSAGAAAEVSWALTPEVKLIFICIGANDGLRGAPPSETKRNLETLIKELQKRGLRVALAGMKMPPNYGSDHARAFEALFPALARERKIPFMPFLLDGVAAVPGLNQADGLHPNPEGHRRIAAAVEAFIDKKGLLR